MTTSDDLHFEVRIKTPSGGRHRMVVKAEDDQAAYREVQRWAKENDKKLGKVHMWEVAKIPGT